MAYKAICFRKDMKIYIYDRYGKLITGFDLTAMAGMAHLMVKDTVTDIGCSNSPKRARIKRAFLDDTIVYFLLSVNNIGSCL